MKNAYPKALSEKFEVKNVSLGRTPIFHHLVAFLENNIQNYDVVILDFYVNSLYYDLPNYMTHVSNLLDLLVATGKIIINIFFPVVDMSDKHFEFYNKSLELTKEKKAFYIDLNKGYQFKNSHYKDKIHLKSEVSYLFGVFLRNFIGTYHFPQTIKGEIISNPYKLIKVDQLLESSLIFLIH